MGPDTSLEVFGGGRAPLTYKHSFSGPGAYEYLVNEFAGRRHTTYDHKPLVPSPVLSTAHVPVHVYAFRGVRHVYGVRIKDLGEEVRQKIRQVEKEFPLLYTGHVGISLDGGRTIYGFGPVVPEGKDLLEDIVPLLKEHVSFTGQVTDDTETFVEAERRHRECGWDTRVYKSVVPLSQAKFERVHRRLEYFRSCRPDEHGYRYSFPLRQPADSEGQTFFHAKHIANCATFPKEALGLDIATWRGSLVRFMRDMVQKAHAKTLATLPLGGWSSGSDISSSDTE